MSSLSCTNPFLWSEVTMMESPMMRNCHVGFGERYEETHQSQDWEVRFVPTPFSPLLANIALHGMEQSLGIKYDKRGQIIGNRIVIRYADDFVCLCETQEDAQAVIEHLNKWLEQRGLKLNQDKTKIVHITEGFDFLGFNVKHYKDNSRKSGYKLLIKPNRQAIKNIKLKIKQEWLKL